MKSNRQMKGMGRINVKVGMKNPGRTEGHGKIRNKGETQETKINRQQKNSGKRRNERHG